MKFNKNYTKLDKSIDKYLGTSNLRPGPQERILNRQRYLEPTFKEPDGPSMNNIKKTNIDYFAYSLEIKTGINWSE